MTGQAHDDIPPPQPVLPLDYGRRRRPWRRTILRLCMVAMAAAAIGCGPGLAASLKRRWLFHRAGEFVIPSGTLIYSQRPAGAALGTAGREFRRRIGGDGLVFLHRRQCIGGPERLVELHLMFDGDSRMPGGPARTLGLDSYTYAIGPFGSASLINVGLSGRWDFTVSRRADGLDVFGGDADPVDASHFTFDYRLNSQTITTDVWLQPDGTLKAIKRPPVPAGP